MYFVFFSLGSRYPGWLSPRLFNNSKINYIPRIHVLSRRQHSSHSTFTGITEENVKREYFGYERSRCRLDTTYHNYYTKERQLVQNEIIRKFLTKVPRQERPWLLLTAGPMGSGKTRTMKWLGKKGYIPLNNLVRINPDTMKKSLPEYNELMQENPAIVGARLRAEIGCISETIFWESAFCSYSIWYDTSLRHGEFFARMLLDLKRDFPHYRVGVIHVHADKEKVYQRGKQRALITGRVVPVAEITKSIEQVPLALDVLRNKVDLDFFGTLDNTEDFALEDCEKYIGREANESAVDHYTQPANCKTISFLKELFEKENMGPNCGAC